MKILLCCAGGMSTSILMKKMQKYWNEKGEELVIEAVGVDATREVAPKYDICMCGPQVSYRLKDIKEYTQLPTAAIDSVAYAIADCPKIYKLAEKLYAEK